MAAASSCFLVRNPTLPGSRFWISDATTKGSTGRVRVSECRAVCHSPLLTSPKASSTRPNVDFAEAKSKFSFSFLTEETPIVAKEDEREEIGIGMNWEMLLPWQMVQPAAREAENARDVSDARSRSDAESLVHRANVMWFKGPYNAEIVCGADEPAESIVRRFRGAVLRAGVISECHRRRYRETRQDTVKRKRRTASVNRRRRSTFGPRAGTDNTWRLSREHLQTADHRKDKRGKKNLRNSRGPPKFYDKAVGSDQDGTDDIDDGNWDYPVEDDYTPR